MLTVKTEVATDLSKRAHLHAKQTSGLNKTKLITFTALNELKDSVKQNRWQWVTPPMGYVLLFVPILKALKQFG